MPAEPSRQQITAVLLAHGHYREDPEEIETPELAQIMRMDAEHLLAIPRIYDEVDALLLDVGLHDPDDCNDVCVRAVLEVLSDAR